MKRTNDIAALAASYGYPVEFVGRILSRITNPGDLWRACDMYNRGTLSADAINDLGAPKIDIPAIRHAMAVNLANKRKLRSEQIRDMMAKQQAIAEFYSSCDRVDCAVARIDEKTDRASVGKQSVFIRNGRLVAFGYWDESGDGGIYMANNDVMPAFHWDRLHNELGNIRRRSRLFYKRIKRAARREPLATWRFDERTIRK